MSDSEATSDSSNDKNGGTMAHRLEPGGGIKPKPRSKAPKYNEI